MLRRKRMPPDLERPWEAFSAQAARVERGSQALLGCLPVGRVEPAPVTAGLEVMAGELRAVSAEAHLWKVEQVLRHWEACVAAVGEALGKVDDVRRVAESTDEMLHVVEAVTELVDTLDPWYDAERFWLTLRVRG